MSKPSENAGNLTSLRIGAATLNQTPLDLKGNVARILSAMDGARRAGIQVLVLPELCMTGYGCEDAFFRPDLCAKALRVLASEIAPASAGMICTVGFPLMHQGALYNAVAVLAGGQVAGINAKRRLPRDGVHYEPRWFAPWPDGKMVDIEVNGLKIGCGDLVYECRGIRIALEICEEAWGAVPAGASAAGFADLVLNPSASHFSLGKYETREHLVANSSRSFGVYYVYSNLVGLEAGRVIYDGGALIACDGKVLARGRRFTFTDHDLIFADANVDIVRSSKVRKGSFPGQMRGGDPSSEMPSLNVVKVPDFSLIEPAKTAHATAGSPRPEWSREEEFLLAEALALFDYLRKSRARGFALSLSGGCDSSVCAVLVAEMRRLAVAALGQDEFCKRAGLDDDAIDKLLLCVWQATAQSSTATRDAARLVARETGARLIEVDIQPAVDFYLAEAARVSGRKLDWATDDLALQNIQSRSRAPMVWLLANIEGRLLLTTGNRSEAATGYTTMDGDSAGGLAPLAGVDKAFLLSWAKWASANPALGGSPWQSLKAVLQRPPTAELRPPSAHQTDEADLMPYGVLSLIEACRLRDRLSVEATVDTVLRALPSLPGVVPPGISPDLGLVSGWVDRFEQLWRTSQWKRERLAAGFHIDDFSVDSRSYCRFPIFSG